jgi:uncharacterized protein involved in type VI secretion and phage assembly
MSLFELLHDDDEETRVGKRINGVAVGVVTNNRDPEGLGRVKVKFPWLSEDTETDWAKIATLYAGGGRGAELLPEVEDEVLVAFEHGDVNFPYVIGALWNTEQKPPEKNEDGKNNIKMIRSRSGHRILFNDDDQGQQEKVEVHSNGGHVVTLSDETGREHILIQDKTSSNLVKIDSNKNTIAIEAGLEVSIKAPSIKIKGQMIVIDAGATMQIKAGGIVTIQGGIVKIN